MSSSGTKSGSTVFRPVRRVSNILPSAPESRIADQYVQSVTVVPSDTLSYLKTAVNRNPSKLRDQQRDRNDPLHNMDTKAMDNANWSDITAVAFQGDTDRLRRFVENNPKLVNKKYDASVQNLLSIEEMNDPFYIPPPQIPKNVRSALYQNQKNKRMSLDHRWLLANSFSGSTLLHYACAGDQYDAVVLLLDNDADSRITNLAGKEADFYSLDDRIKTLLRPSSDVAPQSTTHKTSSQNGDAAHSTTAHLVQPQLESIAASVTALGKPSALNYIFASDCMSQSVQQPQEPPKRKSLISRLIDSSRKSFTSVSVTEMSADDYNADDDAVSAVSSVTNVTLDNSVDCDGVLRRPSGGSGGVKVRRLSRVMQSRKHQSGLANEEDNREGSTPHDVTTAAAAETLVAAAAVSKEPEDMTTAYRNIRALHPSITSNDPIVEAWEMREAVVPDDAQATRAAGLPDSTGALVDVAAAVNTAAKRPVIAAKMGLAVKVGKDALLSGTAVAVSSTAESLRNASELLARAKKIEKEEVCEPVVLVV
jgi:hypothetical protein